MKSLWLSLLVVGLPVAVACAQATPPPKDPPPPASASGASTSDPTPATSGPNTTAPPQTTATSDAPPTSPASGECLATLSMGRTARKVGWKPDAWSQVGTIVVTLRDKKPVKWELHDASDKVLSSGDAPPSAPEFRDAARKEACKIGGVLVFAETEPPAAGPFTLRVLKPRVQDEAGDLKTMCGAAPPVVDGKGLDKAQTVIIALEIYEELLTSPKWRSFVLGARKELKAAPDDAARDKIRHAKGAELRAANKDCWFAGALEK